MIKFKNKESKETTPSPEVKKKDGDGSTEVATLVWKIMKYTQGDNENGLIMKLLMPVFVHVQTLSETETEKEFEVKILVSLPIEFQEDKSDPNKVPKEPPAPKDADIYFEVFDEFKCYVR